MLPGDVLFVVVVLRAQLLTNSRPPTTNAATFVVRSSERLESRV